MLIYVCAYVCRCIYIYVWPHICILQKCLKMMSATISADIYVYIYIYGTPSPVDSCSESPNPNPESSMQLPKVFSQYGTVTDASVLPVAPGKTAAPAFVTMGNLDDAKRGVVKLVFTHRG